MKLTVQELYWKMRQNMGPSGWWPADSKEEIIIGAILIQNTNWRNADRARLLFKKQTDFKPSLILAMTTEELQNAVRPAGFFRNKSKAIYSIFSWLDKYNFDYSAIKNIFGADLRHYLLQLHGVGEETADVLLTYVFEVPTFISDKYARTLFTLLGIQNLTDYRSLAKLYQLNNDFTVEMAKDFHGLIDEFGKVYFHPLTKFNESFLAHDELLLK